jgi:hypothetical protein
MDKIIIGTREFLIAKPVFIILDTLKNETGMDFALGMDMDKTKEIMADMKTLPKVISLITVDEIGEEFDEEKVKAREDYLYKNAQLSDFLKVLGFFSQQLKVKEAGSTEQSKEVTEKPRKGNLKLVKAN